MASNYDALMHLDSDDAGKWKLVARNAANYLNALPEESFTLAIVANAKGATLFLKDRADVRELYEPLMRRGVRLMVCANALRENGISQDSVLEGCAIVTSGVVELVKLQREGFAYIKP